MIFESMIAIKYAEKNLVMVEKFHYLKHILIKVSNRNCYATCAGWRGVALRPYSSPLRYVSITLQQTPRRAAANITLAPVTSSRGGTHWTHSIGFANVP